MANLNVLSLFSGIGGLELGLERAGMTVVGQVEIDPFCRSVLARHWPEVPRHDDVRTAVDWWRGERRPAVHVVAGGFPCQPFSGAGRRRGTTDERWGWPWFNDVVRALRPDYVVVENVAAFLADRDAFGWLLGDLATSGYDAEWDCVPAASVGAPHLRDRVFVVAYPSGPRRRENPRGALGDEGTDGWRAAAHHHLTDRDGQGRRSGHVAHPNGQPKVWTAVARPQRHQWPTEPDVARVANGVPRGVDRRRSLGNAVAPQVAEHIGRLIVNAERAEVKA